MYKSLFIIFALLAFTLACPSCVATQTDNSIPADARSFDRRYDKHARTRGHKLIYQFILPLFSLRNGLSGRADRDDSGYHVSRLFIVTHVNNAQMQRKRYERV